VVHLLFCANVLLARDLLETVLDNVHVVNLLVVYNIASNLVGSDGFVQNRGVMNHTLGKDGFVAFVVHMHLKVVLYNMLFTTHDALGGHGLGRLLGHRSNVLVQHVDGVGIGGASRLHRLVFIPHGRLRVCAGRGSVKRRP